GPDQSVCQTSAIVNGNLPAFGTGAWSFVSGPIPATITTAGTQGFVSGMNLPGVYVFRWSIGTANCPPSMDEVSVVASQFTAAGLVTGGQTVCANNNNGVLFLTGQ